MKIVIIEDEVPAFNRLQKLIQQVAPDTEVMAHLDSVSASKDWFGNNPLPDIVFMDVHLADGSAFDLLDIVQIECPIIFTTAYNEYAVNAFKTSSIAYLLKPVKKEDLQTALQKLEQFKNMFLPTPAVALPFSGQQARTPGDYKKRFLIRFGEYIKTLNVDEIAYFFSENRATFARSFEGRTYPMDNNLDSLEQILDPLTFFRINRQYLINLKSIAEMKTYSKARVIITLKPNAKEQPIVSSERAAAFKNWLAGEV